MRFPGEARFDGGELEQLRQALGLDAQQRALVGPRERADQPGGQAHHQQHDQQLDEGEAAG